MRTSKGPHLAARWDDRSGMVNASLIAGIRELGTLLEPIRPRPNDVVDRPLSES
jgi:hypothetical protein